MLRSTGAPQTTSAGARPCPNAATLRIVWGNQVFVTQAIGDQRTVLAFDRMTGKLLWQQGVTHAEKEQTHETNPYCSATPVTDGERVFATFGSAGVHAFDVKGKKLWSRDLGARP